MAVEVISKLKPKNNGSFFIADASDIETQDGKSLEEQLDEIRKYEAILNQMIENETVDYVKVFEAALVGNTEAANDSDIVQIF